VNRQKLTVLQWNVWYKEDIRNAAALLKEYPADVVCLQELTIQDVPAIGHTPDYIAKQLGYHHFYKEIDLGEGKINIANGIFSKYPIVSTNWQWINEASGTGHYDDEYRAYVEVTLDVDGMHVTVATTHMSYTNSFVSTPRKMQETQRLADILENKKERFIFTGDLNAAPDSPTIQTISKSLQNVGPDFAQPTWTTKPFSYDGFEETELKWRLDYIFATPDVKAINTKVLHTDYSDHLPVWAEIELP
jgi:endonuclease/exonuclease/phosphatase family metal-dependent hydrolase